MATVIIQQLSEAEIKKRGIATWPVWTKEVSRFDYTYEETEECYFMEGEVVIETSEGSFHIKPMDFVTFEEGLICVWDIRKNVKKHYNFW